MNTYELKNRFYNSIVLYSEEANSYLEFIQNLVASRANLSGANLSGANLSGANLSGANYLNEALHIDKAIGYKTEKDKEG